MGRADSELVSFFLELGISLSSEMNIYRLLEKIVNESIDLTNSDGCTLYLLEGDGALHFSISRNISLGISESRELGGEDAFPPVPMDPSFVSAYVAINKKLVNVTDVYKSTEFDFRGPKQYDLMNNYRSISMLVSPLLNHEGDVIGVLQLLNAKDMETGEVIPFNAGYEMVIKSLSSFAAFAISNTRLVEEIHLRADKLKEANLDAIYALAMAAETKDADTGDHVRRIQLYSIALSKEIGLSDERADEIGYSSIMHDVGKISVPDSILKKPGKLTKEEFDIMKQHPIAGAKILPDSFFFHTAKTIARGHHEKWDGRGYPDGLVGEKIPMEARIVAIADVFDALVNKRCYKDGWTMDQAIDEMIRCAGTHFDPELIEAWNELYKEGKLKKIHDVWSD
jgi:HD-GYP domain-containing protein (c-di-GMP phosphodiesterase class II)